jgi:AmmeMemoRadiSam system radical SAM enzyme/AmmeMemoRadiSam system protein B
MQYYKQENDHLICLLCSHYCKLKPDQIGICGVNKNTGSKIECLVYGYISAINIDPVEKKPLYHFLPNTKTLSFGTVGCNFSCPFCQNHGISQEHNIDKSNYYTPYDLVSLAIKHNCDSISFTYNEPTIFYPFAKDVAKLAHKYNLKTIFVSNGFESKEMIDDMKGVIDAVNIDLKTFNSSYYKKELKGELNTILQNLKQFKKNGIHIEITTLIIPTKNDSDQELENIANFIAKELDIYTPWHLSAFHPSYKQLDIARTTIDLLNKAYKIGQKAGLKHIYRGNASLPNPTYCANCGYELINRVTYEIKKNDLVQTNLCPKCKTKLRGVFMSVRETSFDGSFYPDNCSDIKKYINHFTNILDNNNFNPNLDFVPKAIIVPHAGYIYSGFTANIAYNIIQKIKPKRFLIIAPSHKIAFDGISIGIYDQYATPCGKLKIDKDYSNTLINKYDFCNFYDQVHTEHSSETQAPFIKHYFNNIPITEAIYGKIDYKDIQKIITDAFNDNTFVIISTDLSHFYDLKKANKLDNICLKAINDLDINIWNQGCEACGRVGVKALISYAKQHNLNSKILDYRTSADQTKDEQRVVGYTSAVIG